MKTKYKILVALTLLVVFGLGVAAGILGERYVVHKQDRRTTAGRPHAPSPESWAKELGLTPDQQTKIHEIFKRNEERMKAFRTENRARLAELRKMLSEEINAVLTPEQKSEERRDDPPVRGMAEKRSRTKPLARAAGAGRSLPGSREIKET